MPERAALVTGASSGIGLAIADVLGAEGYGLTVQTKRADMQLDLNLRAIILFWSARRR